jgi:hypothetical protein
LRAPVWPCPLAQRGAFRDPGLVVLDLATDAHGDHVVRLRLEGDGPPAADGAVLPVTTPRTVLGRAPVHVELTLGPEGWTGAVLPGQPEGSSRLTSRRSEDPTPDPDPRTPRDDMASPEEMAAKMIANLKEKTGRTLPQWLKVTKAAKLEKHGQIVRLLKEDHGVSHGFANLIAHETLQSSSYQAKPSDDLVGAQYSGRKEGLRPIYDAVLAAVTKFGGDVEVSPKKAYVSLRRNKQFAIVQPSTATRVDVGLVLKGVDPTDRLEEAGSWNSMCTHRVRCETKRDVDAELRKWLKQAYAAC